MALPPWSAIRYGQPPCWQIGQPSALSKINRGGSMGMISLAPLCNFDLNQNQYRPVKFGMTPMKLNNGAVSMDYQRASDLN